MIFRWWKSRRTPEPSPEFVAQLHEFIKRCTREQVAAVVRALNGMEGSIHYKLEKIMHSLDDLLAAVATQKTKIDSLIQLVVSLKGQVTAVMGGTLTPSQQMRIDQVFDAVAANADEVDAAITANTVQAAAGAISDGPSASDIKSSTAGTNISGQTSDSGGIAPAANPGNSPGSQAGTGSGGVGQQSDLPQGSDKAPAS